MHLADHIRPLLRDHDCVIIPDFGGLVADASPARVQPGRQALGPPTKLVAFNQALTRNDGLLVDALSQHLGLPIAQAREAVRAAVAGLKQELDETNRTELPGIGIFRRAAGRGLAFEYTGSDNLLASAYGLPELVARPVRANDARSKRPQPALRGASTRRTRVARLLPGGIIALAAGLLFLANYQFLVNRNMVSAKWQSQLPKLEWAQQRTSGAASLSEPQQATLGQRTFTSAETAADGLTPLTAPEASASVAPVAQPIPTLENPTAKTVEPAATVAETTPVTEPKALAKTVETPVAAAKPAVAPAPVAPAPPKAKATAATNSVTIKNRTGRYYVIAGAYGSLANAEKGRKILARNGHNARIILPPFGSRLFRLTAGDYADLASAQREAQRLRVSTHCDYNTLKF
ncbi:SPOR domain-containing protein [Hymenobacter sp. BT523]|uniref:HU domain-containing protein n=1 Tax=Hymenobacter sp. BT523 TaxID=2795725 RepID=UPI0018EA7980|nr:SPOR domain-containing protein [Hymenobacter sp. BT523]MBJ6111179.1 SPOR domain-containing protein [Hymenobacter sp. BT523]